MKDSTKIVVMEDDAMERDILVRKDFHPSIWCKCRICSTMKTEKECRQEVEAVLDFNLQGILVLNQAMILSELTHDLMISFSICFCNQVSEPLPYLRWSSL